MVWKFIMSIVEAVESLYYDPHDINPRSLPMNQEPIEQPIEVLTALEAMLKASKAALGTELSPLDPVGDNVACADSLTNLIKQIYPTFPKAFHTADLLKRLKESSHFVGTMEVQPGCIIINATGSGNGKIRGHCGVIGENGRIHSNNSLTGLWDDYFTIDSWRERYRIKGGMPTLLFKPI